MAFLQTSNLPKPASPSFLHHSTTATTTATAQIQHSHARAIKTGSFNNDPTVATKLVESCCATFQRFPPNSIEVVNYALSLFDRSVHSSSFVYNTLIRALNQVHEPQQALLLFYEMLNDTNTVTPDKFTFPSVLKSCALLSASGEGEQVHAFVLKNGFVSDPFVHSCLIHMYVRCGMIESARKVFEEMPSGGGGGGVNMVAWNSMIDGLVKSGDVELARRLFDEMPERNIVSWNCMIAGLAKEELYSEALKVFEELQVSGLSPDEATVMSILPVVLELGLLSLGERVHGYVIRHEFSLESRLGAAIIDMYAKCGSITNALQVFRGIRNKNVGHWTSMIVGFAIHGFAEAALELFSEMQNSGVKPNHVTFVAVLSACSHGGLVEKGIKQFNLMRSYGIEPGVQHYGCLVDLLSRCGLLKEAKMIIEHMPMEPGTVIWSMLLAASRNHGDVEIGEIAWKNLLELDPEYGGGNVLLSKLYADSCRWEDFGKMRRMIEEKGVEKAPGISWIEVDGEINEFLIGDKFHPRSWEIYRLLDEMECILRWKEV